MLVLSKKDQVQLAKKKKKKKDSSLKDTFYDSSD